MIEIKCKDVCVDFPVYGSNSRSFKKSLLSIATGGSMNVDSSENVTIRALDNINLTVKEGDRVGLIGHNGSGKTTLLRVMAGAYEPTSGSILVKGNVSSMLSITLGMDMDSTGLENIYLRGALMGLKSSDIENLIDEILEFAEIGDYIYMPMRTYSSGMTMRLAFGIATSVKSDIILMDEWLSVGDKNFSKKAQNRLNSMVNEAKILILASHDPSLIANNCTKIIKMEHGRIVNVSEFLNYSTGQGVQHEKDQANFHIETRPNSKGLIPAYDEALIMLLIDPIESNSETMVVEPFETSMQIVPGQNYILLPNKLCSEAVNIKFKCGIEGKIQNSSLKETKLPWSYELPLIITWNGFSFQVVRIENAIDVDQNWLPRIYSSILASLDCSGNINIVNRQTYWDEISRLLGSLERNIDGIYNSFYIKNYISGEDHQIKCLTANLRDTGITVAGDNQSRFYSSTGFMLRKEENINAIWLKIGVVGNPNGALKLELRNDDGLGKPGELNESYIEGKSEINANEFFGGSDCAWTRFKLSEETNLKKEIPYHIVIYPSAGVDEMNYWVIRQSDDDRKYTRGYACQGDESGNWVRYITYSWCFIVEGKM